MTRRKKKEQETRFSTKGTDYWVSQEKKYCEFCKCFISANKPSIAFHENGKNHRDNMAKRLAAMQKKAAREAKEVENYEKEMKKIESAALKAYAKDMEMNPDFTSQTMGKITIPSVPGPSQRPTTSSANFEQKKFPEVGNPPKKWIEAMTDTGVRFYWHMQTERLVWEEPKEGFLSLEEQCERGILPKIIKYKQKPVRKVKKNFTKASSKPVEGKANSKSVEGKASSKPVKGKAISKPIEGKASSKPVEGKASSKPVEGKASSKPIEGKASSKPVEAKAKAKAKASSVKPAGGTKIVQVPQGHPYGKWETVSSQNKKPVDLQLPKKKSVKIAVPQDKEESAEKFVEKKIPTPGSIASTSGDTGFRKRKFPFTAKNNTRQRTNYE